MKFSTIATIVTATAGFVAAQPSHRHAHHHNMHKRADNGVVTVYELNGKLISAQEVQEGIENGTLVFDHGSGQLSSAAAVPTPDVNVAAADSSDATPELNVNVDTKPKKENKAPEKAPKKAPSIPEVPDVSGSLQLSSQDLPNISSSDDSFSNDAQGLGSDFPDGQVSCNEFPSKYGAIPVPWMGYGGYTGIQSPESSLSGFANIVTKVTSMCSGADCCSEGDYCSYACPPGWQKSQWPETQGATGQSVGGLLCKGGKLHLTNPGMSKSICMKGTEKVEVQIKNKMSSNTAVCRTDYPGTESEVVPLKSTPGSIEPLTCPDGDNYYNWQGKPTSAQYYVNPKGTSVEEGCQWGNAGELFGNFAPLNLGVGYSAGAAWLSIFQNLPTQNQKLDFTVELVGDNGGFDNFVGKCKYSNGQYCNGDNYENCSSDGSGCTVNVQSGTATFVFSD